MINDTDFSFSSYPKDWKTYVVSDSSTQTLVFRLTLRTGKRTWSVTVAHRL